MTVPSFNFLFFVIHRNFIQKAWNCYKNCYNHCAVVTDVRVGFVQKLSFPVEMEEKVGEERYAKLLNTEVGE